jgi:hypothetical protein
VPPDGVVIDPRKRPVVVVDPRAGEGPGIGGFKEKSEIGDALNAGHPVYFIGFSTVPEPGQRFLDVVEGQVAFFERVVELHPDAPRPFAIGNCQAGVPNVDGGDAAAGSVRALLAGGLADVVLAGRARQEPDALHRRPVGRQLAHRTDQRPRERKVRWDLAGDEFRQLGPANWLWGKQYEVYANVDTAGERYLAFEKWWGDFIQLNGDELQYLVDNFFVRRQADRATKFPRATGRFSMSAALHFADRSCLPQAGTTSVRRRRRWAGWSDIVRGTWRTSGPVARQSCTA